jgi:hypothetical protein
MGWKLSGVGHVGDTVLGSLDIADGLWRLRVVQMPRFLKSVWNVKVKACWCIWQPFNAIMLSVWFYIALKSESGARMSSMLNGSSSMMLLYLRVADGRVPKGYFSAAEFVFVAAWSAVTTTSSSTTLAAALAEERAAGAVLDGFVRPDEQSQVRSGAATLT